jgi:hypothetical protein
MVLSFVMGLTLLHVYFMLVGFIVYDRCGSEGLPR